MAIQIVTQYMENYGSEDQAFWKFKGGSTYVIMAGTERSESYMETVLEIRALVESKHQFSEEFVTGVKLVEDPLEDIEAWESVTYLTKVGGEWRAAKEEFSVDYNEDGDTIRGALRKRETWTMLPDNDRGEYQCHYYGEYA